MILKSGILSPPSLILPIIVECLILGGLWFHTKLERSLLTWSTNPLGTLRTEGLFTRARVGHRPGSVQRRILRLHEPGLGEGWVILGWPGSVPFRWVERASDYLSVRKMADEPCNHNNQQFVLTLSVILVQAAHGRERWTAKKVIFKQSRVRYASVYMKKLKKFQPF